MKLPPGATFPFELATRIASAYETIAATLDSHADHHVRAFTTPAEGFTGVDAEEIRRRVAELAATGHTLADEARQAAGAMYDLIAEARLAEQRDGSSPGGPPVPLHRPSVDSPRAF